MKKTMAVLALAIAAASGSFAEVMLGVTGMQYYAEDSDGKLPGLGQAWDNFRDGKNVYWGGFVEVAGDNLGLAFSFNYDSVKDSGSTVEAINKAMEQWSYDANLRLTYHLFGSDAFLDPMLHLGFGVIAFDFVNKDADTQAYRKATWLVPPYDYADKNDPLAAAAYWDAGLGLGLNFGPVGIFVNGIYTHQIKDSLKGKFDAEDPLVLIGNRKEGEEYPIPMLETFPFKWVFGAKVIF